MFATVTTPDRDDSPAAPARLRRQFGIYRFVSRTYFYLPLLIVAFYIEGASVLALALLTAVYGVCVTLAAPLLPQLVARPAHARLLAGEMLRGVGLALVAAGLLLTPDTVGWVLVSIGQVAGGAGFGVGAGQDSRLLRERLVRAGSGAAFATIEGRTQSLAFATVFVSGFVGVLLLEVVDPAAPFALGAVAAFVSAQVGVRLGEPVAGEAAAAPASPPAGDDGPPPQLPPVDRAIAVYYAATRGTALTTFVFLLPMALVIERPKATLPLVAVLGCFSIAAFAIGRTAGRIVKWGAGRPARLIIVSATPIALCLVGLSIAATTESDLRWLFAALCAVCGGVASAVARPMCFGALSKEGMRAKATEFAERLCSAFNVSAVIVTGLAISAAGDGGWLVIAIAGPVALAVIAMVVLRQWPSSAPNP